VAHPDLEQEQAYIDGAYAALDRMREAVERSPSAGAGEVAQEALEAWASRRLVTFADAQGIWLWHALARADEAGVGAAPLKNVRTLSTLLQSLSAQAQELSVPDLVERVLEQSGYLGALEAERTIEAQGRMENLQELVGVAREYAENAPEPSLSSFLQEISLYSDQDALRGKARS